MRSYGHYCGLARALDVVGDRWALLIVRELLLLGPARYTDLQRGLPGIASNLLATRLRELEGAELVSREAAPLPAPAALFRLTARGEALEPVIAALGAWAGPLMTEPREGDALRSHWLALPLHQYLVDRQPHGRRITIELRTGDEPMLVETIAGEVRARPGSARDPHAVLSGAAHLIIAVLMGRLSLSQARARGLSFSGDTSVLRRLGPRAVA